MAKPILMRTVLTLECLETRTLASASPLRGALATLHKGHTPALLHTGRFGPGSTHIVFFGAPTRGETSLLDVHSRKPKGAPIENSDGSTTQVFSDGSWTQTMPPTSSWWSGTTTTEVREQEANGTVIDTITVTKKNGDSETTILKKEPGAHGTVTREVITRTMGPDCEEKITKVTEIWKWFADPRGHWEHRFADKTFTGVESNPPPEVPPPAPPRDSVEP
jgi:hypothetical protein